MVTNRAKHFKYLTKCSLKESNAGQNKESNNLSQINFAGYAIRYRLRVMRYATDCGQIDKFGNVLVQPGRFKCLTFTMKIMQ